MSDEQIKRLLKVFAKYEQCDSLYWTEELIFYVNCGDLFAWACADAEEIQTDADIDLLEQCGKELEMAAPISGTVQMDTLYACRRRNMLPQPCVFAKLDDEIKPLFAGLGPSTEELYQERRKKMEEAKA